MLDADDTDLIDMWLDPSITDSEVFRPLLNDKIPFNLVATPIQGARNLEPRDEPIEIAADE